MLEPLKCLHNIIIKHNLIQTYIVNIYLYKQTQIHVSLLEPLNWYLFNLILLFTR